MWVARRRVKLTAAARCVARGNKAFSAELRVLRAGTSLAIQDPSPMTPARSRSRSRGVTPIAAALAVLVLGAGASCMWWLKSDAARDGQESSRADAAQIQTAAKAFRAQHADGCPTLSSLR